MPERIRRSRRRGDRLPATARVVSRGTRWGNPFRVGDVVEVEGRGPSVVTVRTTRVRDREHAVELFEKWVDEIIEISWWKHPAPTHEEMRTQLAGHDLACWCPLDGACHADALIERANG